MRVHRLFSLTTQFRKTPARKTKRKDTRASAQRSNLDSGVLTYSFTRRCFSTPPGAPPLRVQGEGLLRGSDLSQAYLLPYAGIKYAGTDSRFPRNGHFFIIITFASSFCKARFSFEGMKVWEIRSPVADE